MCTAACVCTCTTARVGLRSVVPVGIPGALSGVSGKLGYFLLVSPEALYKPCRAPLEQRTPSPRRTRVQCLHCRPEELGTWFVRGVLQRHVAVPSAGVQPP